MLFSSVANSLRTFSALMLVVTLVEVKLQPEISDFILVLLAVWRFRGPSSPPVGFEGRKLQPFHDG